MTKDQLISAHAERNGISQAEAKREIERVVETIKSTAKEQLDNGEKVIIPGILSITTKIAAARKGRNPKTGEPIEIPQRARLKVSYEKGFRDAVGVNG